jgi:hypothetical protein
MSACHADDSDSNSDLGVQNNDFTGRNFNKSSAVKGRDFDKNNPDTGDAYITTEGTLILGAIGTMSAVLVLFLLVDLRESR